MGILNKLFGGKAGTGASAEHDVSNAVATLAALYDDPEVRSERGLSVTGPRANEVREVGRRLYKAGGKRSMEAARDGLRVSHNWAVPNLEAIWASMPQWRA